MNEICRYANLRKLNNYVRQNSKRRELPLHQRLQFIKARTYTNLSYYSSVVIISMKSMNEVLKEQRIKYLSGDIIS